MTTTRKKGLETCDQTQLLLHRHHHTNSCSTFVSLQQRSPNSVKFHDLRLFFSFSASNLLKSSYDSAKVCAIVETSSSNSQMIVSDQDNNNLDGNSGEQQRTNTMLIESSNDGYGSKRTGKKETKTEP